jgi:hypothetical protein
MSDDWKKALKDLKDFGFMENGNNVIIFYCASEENFA